MWRDCQWLRAWLEHVGLVYVTKIMAISIPVEDMMNLAEHYSLKFYHVFVTASAKVITYLGDFFLVIISFDSIASNHKKTYALRPQEIGIKIESFTNGLVFS